MAGDLGAGMARLECSRCGSVRIDLNAAGTGSAPVTAPGLFKPAKPTIFSVLAEERRAEQKQAEDMETVPSSRGPRHAFGGSGARRR